MTTNALTVVVRGGALVLAGAAVAVAVERGLPAKWANQAGLAPPPRADALATGPELRAELDTLSAERAVLEGRKTLLEREQGEDRAALARLAALPTGPDQPGSAELVRASLDFTVAARGRLLGQVTDQLDRTGRRQLTVREALLAGGHDASRENVQGLVDGLAALADDSPKAAVARQFALLLSGTSDELRPLFTPAARQRVTPKAVADGRRLFRDEPLADLAAKFEPAEGAWLVRTKSGRVLTRLVRADGKWLADTVWFD